MQLRTILRTLIIIIIIIIIIIVAVLTIYVILYDSWVNYAVSALEVALHLVKWAGDHDWWILEEEVVESCFKALPCRFSGVGGRRTTNGINTGHLLNGIDAAKLLGSVVT
jgi:hypothetical protein